MRKKVYHYYAVNPPTIDRTTACGRDGYAVGCLIAYFFEAMPLKSRCKTCQKKYKKDQKKA